MYLDPALLNDLAGSVPSGAPDGHDVPARVTTGKDVAPDTNAVEADIDEQRRQAALAHNAGRENEKFSAMQDPKVKSGSFSAVPAIEAARNKADDQYLSMFAKAGVQRNVEQAMERGQPAAGNARNPQNMRAAIAKNPILRKKYAQFRAVANQLLKLPKNKLAALNLRQLPEHLRIRMIMEKLRNGDHVDPADLATLPEDARPHMLRGAHNIGSIVSKLGPLPSPAATARKAARMAGHGLMGAYNRWGHALADGSVLGHMDRPRMKGI